MSEREAMIRVDQAGEYGATRIYAGQLAVMGDRAPHSAEIRAMAEQEAVLATVVADRGRMLRGRLLAGLVGHNLKA